MDSSSHHPGIALVVDGLLTLVVPEFSGSLLKWGVIGVLGIVGFTTLWTALQRRPLVALDSAARVGYLAIAVGLSLSSGQTAAVVAIALGIGLAVLGATIMVRAFRRRGSSENWAFDLVRGAIYIAAGAVVIVLPDAITSSLVLAVAAGALLLGGLTIAVGMNVSD